ncbi:MAG: hypothetical protein ACSHX8_02315 [Opitutaceae bacterium]
MIHIPISRAAVILCAYLLSCFSCFAALTLEQVSGYDYSIYSAGSSVFDVATIEDDSVDALRGQTIVTRVPGGGEAGWSLEYLVLRYKDYTNTRVLGPDDEWEVTIVEWQPSIDGNDATTWEAGSELDPLAAFVTPNIILQDSGAFVSDTSFFRQTHLKFNLETPVFIEAEKIYGVYFTNKNSKGESFQVAGSQTDTVVTGAMLLQSNGQVPEMIDGKDLGLYLHGSAVAAPDDRDIAPRFTLGGDVERPLDFTAYSDVHATGFNAHNDGQSLVGYTVVNSNNGLFSVQPSIANDGTLTFASAAGASGEATVTVYATDDGATNNQSLAKTFTITITDRVAQIVYVNMNTPAAALAQDGESWATAYADLQDALAAAVTFDEIWVAKGRYYPDEAVAGVASVSADNRSEDFQLSANIPVYGGFSGGETQRDERLPKVNRTILSGDIDQNDSTVNGVILDDPQNNVVGNNTYTVVRGVYSGDSVLDGFIITAASGGSGAYVGGGVLRSCVIRGNSGSTVGGVNAYTTSLDMIDCELYGNVGNSAGAISLYVVDLTMVSCRVQGNLAYLAYRSGVGGIRVGDSHATLINCVVSGNVGSSAGGVLLMSFENGFIPLSLAIENSTVTGNYATLDDAESAGGLSSLTTEGAFTVANSIVWGNWAPTAVDVYGMTAQDASLVAGLNPGGTNVDGTDPLNDPDFLIPLAASAAASTGGDFRLSISSPALSTGQFGDLGLDEHDLDLDLDTSEVLPYDIDQNARVIGTLDLGAFEYVAEYSPLDLYRGSVGLDTDGSEDNADTSGNGVENVFYFAFSMGDPMQTSIRYADIESGISGMPSAQQDAASGRYQLTYVHPKGAGAGVSVIIECSQNAVDWVDVLELTGDAAIQVTDVDPIDDDYEFVTIEFNVGVGVAFYRARVSVN